MGAEGDDSSGNSYLWRKSRIFRAKHRSRVKGGQSPGGAGPRRSCLPPTPGGCSVALHPLCRHPGKGELCEEPLVQERQLHALPRASLTARPPQEIPKGRPSRGEESHGSVPFQLIIRNRKDLMQACGDGTMPREKGVQPGPRPRLCVPGEPPAAQADQLGHGK